MTPTGYAHMTHMLSGLAGGKLVVALEVCVIIVRCSITGRIHFVGWLQSRLNLQLSIGSYKGHSWRGSSRAATDGCRRDCYRNCLASRNGTK